MSPKLPLYLTIIALTSALVMSQFTIRNWQQVAANYQQTAANYQRAAMNQAQRMLTECDAGEWP